MSESSAERDAAGVPRAGQSCVYVVLVNWNGWRDSIECLESVFRSAYPEFRVVICDNGSHDDSLRQIRLWAEGRLEAAIAPENPLASLVRPPVRKPVSTITLTRAEAEAGGDDGASAALVLVDAAANLGFAGGCNVGTRYALSQPDCGYVWLLNNDTVVDPSAMRALVDRLRERPDAGLCGSRLVHYHAPALVEALGGERYDRWTSRSVPVGAELPVGTEVDVAQVERSLSYLKGASICATRSALEEVGLMDESYFLYFEEVDWAARARARFALAYAHDSIVYHKEGGSIGSHRQGARRSMLSDYFQVRNRLRFTARHAPVALPTVIAGVLLAVLNRLRRGQPDRALMILRLVFSPTAYAIRSAEAPQLIVERLRGR